MKKILALLLVVILTATVSISGTLAFVQANAEPEDTITEGEVSIDQEIYYREYSSGEGTQTCTLKEREGTKNDKGITVHGAFNLYPAVYTGDKPSTDIYEDSLLGGENLYTAPNIYDEIVVVKNTSKQNAYVRTWIAVECGSMDKVEFEKYVTLKRNEDDNSDWTWSEGKVETYEGKSYYVLLATYKKVLSDGEKTTPSLLQVMLNKETGNDQCAALDGNGDYTLEIRILSQAAPQEFGSTAQEALESCFKTNSPWTPAEPTT